MSSHTGNTDDELWDSLNRIIETVPLEENRAILLRYLQERAANGMKPATLGIDANAVRAFMLHLDKKCVEQATRQDVVGYLNTAKKIRRWVNRKKDGTETVTEKPERLSPRTINKRKEILKPFFKWLRQTTDDPPEIKGLKNKKGGDEDMPVDELISRDDLAALIQALPEVQDKAKVAILYDSGLRASEFCALNVGSVVFDPYGAVITLPKGAPGLKTGSRRVRVFESVPFLHAWFELHPRKKDPRAPLWLTMSNNSTEGSRLKANSLWYFVVKAAEKADLKKDVWPHLFRHSAATERARLGWNEGQMRAFFGWSKGSDMPSLYVHLAGRDYEDAELERRGLKGRDEKGASALLPLKCGRCGTENPLTSVFCASCRQPVSPEAEAAIDKQRQAEIEVIARKMVEEKLKEQMTQIVKDRETQPM